MANLMFRDGPRDVADHIEALLKDNEVDTMRYTYREAIEVANRRMEHEPLRRAIEGQRRDHLRRFG